MGFDDPFADRKPQPGAGDSLGIGHTVKLIKDALQVFLRDRRPLVGDLDDYRNGDLALGQ